MIDEHGVAMASVSVIGGGLIGLLTAYALRKQGNQVVVIDKSELGSEASWAGGGILCPLYPWKNPRAVNELAYYGHQQYQSLVQALWQRTGIDAQWYRSGMLVLDGYKDADAWLNRYEHESYRLDQTQLAQRFIGLSSNFVEGLWLPGMAQLRNPRLIKALYKALTDMDVTLLNHTEVKGVTTKGDQQVSSLKTTAGDICTDKYVLTAGAWSGGLAPTLGFDAMDVAPVKGQMLLFKYSSTWLKSILLYKGVYFIPRRDGYVLLGSTVENVGFDKSVSVSAKNHLIALGQEILPDLSEDCLQKQWSGLRPGKTNGTPVIDKSTMFNNVWANTGHFRNGIVMGVGSVCVLMDIMRGKQSFCDISAYKN